MKPVVSVITPVLNRKDYLRQTVASVQRQTLAEWEMILVDDGSTDGAGEMVRENFGSDSRVRFIKRAGIIAGANACRNQGSREAGGEFLVYLDSDDLLAPQCLEKRVGFMRENPALDFAVFYCAVFFREPEDSDILWNVFCEKDDFDRFLSFDIPWGTASVIWKKKPARFLGWDENLLNLQDVDLHMRALASGLKYSKVPVKDCFYRLNAPGSIGRKSPDSSEHLKSRVLFFRKTAQCLHRIHAGSASRAAFAATIASHCDHWLEKRRIGTAFSAWFSGLRHGLYDAGFFLRGMKIMLKTVLTGAMPRMRNGLFEKIKEHPKFYIYNPRVCAFAGE